MLQVGGIEYGKAVMNPGTRFALFAMLLGTLSGCDGCRDEEDDTPPDVLPTAPDGVSASADGSASALVTWNDRSDNEAGFIIQISLDATTWIDAASYGQNATSGRVTGLTPGTTAHIRVASQNVKGPVPSLAHVTILLPLPAWATLADGPGPTLWSCSAYDGTRDWMIVFGGLNLTPSDPPNPLWALDLSATPPEWIPVPQSNTPPLSRFGASMVYDPAGDRLLIFGGDVDGQGVSSDVLQFDLELGLWSAPTVLGTAPAPRQFHSAVLDPLRGMVVYGGEDPASLQGFDPDVHILPLSGANAMIWQNGGAAGLQPQGRSRHSAVYDDVSRRMIVFGGNDGLSPPETISQTADVRVMNLRTLTWEPFSPAGTGPGAREGHVAAWDSHNRQLVFFSGGNDDITVNDELWTLNFEGAPTWRFFDLAAQPSGAKHGTAVFDPVGRRMLIFGGFDGSSVPTAATYALDF